MPAVSALERVYDRKGYGVAGEWWLTPPFPPSEALLRALEECRPWTKW